MKVSRVCSVRLPVDRHWVRVQDSAVFSVVVHQAASEAVHRQVTAVAKVDRQRVTAAAVVAEPLQDTGVVAKVDRQQGTAAAAVAEHLQDTGVVPVELVVAVLVVAVLVVAVRARED